MDARHAMGPDRRVTGDRRAGRASLHYPERRTGYDRRESVAATKAGVAYRSWLRSLSDSPFRFGVIAASLFLLGAADLMFTYRALGRGAVELNPVMAGLLGAGHGLAGVVKIGVTGVVAIGVWRFRRFRRVVEVSLFLTVMMAGVVLYHVAAITVS